MRCNASRDASGPASAWLWTLSPTLVLRLSILLVALATGASAQGALDALANAPAAPPTAARDVVLGGVSVVGRWHAVEVAGDAAATADLARGTLTTVLVINPTGHVILRGTDARQGQGAPASFSGYVVNGRLRFSGLDGEALLERHGRALHLVDPRGRRTVLARR